MDLIIHLIILWGWVISIAPVDAPTNLPGKIFRTAFARQDALHYTS